MKRTDTPTWVNKIELQTKKRIATPSGKRDMDKWGIKMRFELMNSNNGEAEI